MDLNIESFIPEEEVRKFEDAIRGSLMKKIDERLKKTQNCQKFWRFKPKV